MSFIKTLVGAAWKLVDTVNVFKVYVVPGAWKDVTFLRVFELYNGQVGWREVWAKGAPPPPPPAPEDPPIVEPPIALNVTITPTSPTSGTLRTDTAPNTVTVPKLTNAVATVSNGTGPYIYQWTRVSWSSATPPQITAPAAAATKFTQLIGELDTQETATFRCTVQDSLGNTGSAQIDVTFLLADNGGIV